MSKTASETGFLTMGQVAERIGQGAQVWQIVRIFNRELLPPAMRLGRYRVVPEGRLKEIATVLREAGFLKHLG